MRTLDDMGVIWVLVAECFVSFCCFLRRLFMTTAVSIYDERVDLSEDNSLRLYANKVHCSHVSYWSLMSYSTERSECTLSFSFTSSFGKKRTRVALRKLRVLEGLAEMFVLLCLGALRLSAHCRTCAGFFSFWGFGASRNLLLSLCALRLSTQID